jgi:hypothetical protein
VTAVSDVLFAAVHPQPKVSGRLIFVKVFLRLPWDCQRSASSDLVVRRTLVATTTLVARRTLMVNKFPRAKRTIDWKCLCVYYSGFRILAGRNALFSEKNLRTRRTWLVGRRTLMCKRPLVATAEFVK